MKHYLKKSSVAFLLMISCMSMVLIACRKVGIEKSEETNAIRARFFDASKVNNPKIKALIKGLQLKDAERPFAVQMAKSSGFPVWDRTVVANRKKGLPNRAFRTESEGDTAYFYTPYVADEYQNVQAVLITRAVGEDTSYKFIRANDYVDWPVEPSDDGGSATATDVAKLFLGFEKYVFDKSDFTIKDRQRIFRVNFGNVYVKSITVTIHANSIQVCKILWRDPDSPYDDPEHSNGNESYYDMQCETTYLGGGGTWGGGTNGNDDPPPPPSDNGGGGINGLDAPNDHHFVDNPHDDINRFQEEEPVDNFGGWGPAFDLTDENGFYLSRWQELSLILQQNPNALIPCDKINLFNGLSPFYQNLYDYTVDASVKTRIDNLVNNPSLNLDAGNFFIQELGHASSNVVNIDYFPLNITVMPTINGQQLSSEQLLEYFRKNINGFISSSASFSPYVHGGIDDTNLWNQAGQQSQNSLVHIDLTPNDGTVILSNYTNVSNPVNNQFTFTTMRTPLDGWHPVSGHRRFGIFGNTQNGGFTFYIGGIDRISRNDFAFGNWATFDSGFDSADALWRSIITNLKVFINTNGGSAQTPSVGDFTARPNYDLLAKYLKKEINYNQLKALLGC